MNTGVRLETLLSPFKELITEALDELKAEGVILVPYMTIRSPWEQAKLWRRSRSSLEVDKALTDLETLGAKFIASCLRDVGPQSTAPWATNALPGQSWHQWGEAIDCYLEEGGIAIWDSSEEGYQKFAEKCKAKGLESGHFWSKKDSVHVQLRKERVTSVHSWEEIDRRIEEMFHKPEVAGFYY